MDGELARVVQFPPGGRLREEVTVRRNARAGQEYWVHAACVSPVPGQVLSYEVRSSKVGSSAKALVKGEVPCDGEKTVDGVGELAVKSVALYLTGDRSDATSAYAVIAPAP